MRPISVLFTNNALGPRGGSETYVRDVALALLRHGHRPTAFSLVHGDVADELHRATVPVIDDITRLGAPPDVIHGHHHLETLIAALAFPDTPVVNFCHGWLPWEEMPLHHPSVRRYVAVDEVCADRLIREQGIAPAQVELLLNFVDLSRFARRAPLPERPARALVLSNAARPSGYAHAIQQACDTAGITLDIIGAAAGNATDAPERLLAGYDLVFAKGRTALEALAVGCATILADAAGAGPMVTPAAYERLRNRNFGIRELRQAHAVAWYRDQLAQYDASRCTEVTERIRVEADQERAIARLLEIYAAAMTTPPGTSDPSRAAALHCSRIAKPLKQSYYLHERVIRLESEAEVMRRDLLDIRVLQGHIAALRVEESEHRRSAQETAQRLATTLDQVELLERQVAAFQALPTLRLRDAVLRIPVLGAAMQRIARRFTARS
jgi:hypothetical protein